MIQVIETCLLHVQTTCVSGPCPSSHLWELSILYTIIIIMMIESIIFTTIGTSLVLKLLVIMADGVLPVNNLKYR